jgi:hypothetical protein
VTHDAKAPLHMRLTTTARALLWALSKKKGVSQTAIVELAARQVAEQEGVSEAEALKAYEEKEAQGERVGV